MYSVYIYICKVCVYKYIQGVYIYTNCIVYLYLYMYISMWMILVPYNCIPKMSWAVHPVADRPDIIMSMFVFIC